MKTVVIAFSLLTSMACTAQQSYIDSMQAHINRYTSQHAVVKGEDRSRLSFYPVNPAYKVEAVVALQPNSPWFKMDASGPIKQLYRVYGIAKFKLNGEEVQLNIYQNQGLMQSEKYAEHLFLPFSDATAGLETYEGGRYIDLSLSDLATGKVIIDFNKAYNPYCAYVAGRYSCPIPPPENRLNIAIEAGEKKYNKEP